jgi:hypothetical protein
MDDWSQPARALLAMLQGAAPFLRCTAAGVLGAVANIALGERAVVLPRVEDGKLYLGFIGNLVVALAMAYVVGHDFRTAFFAAVCGTTTLRAFKQRIEDAFEDERKELDGDHGSQ